MPTVLPLSSRLSTVYLIRLGVTVPSRKHGKTKITIQAKNAAQIRRLSLIVTINTPEISRIRCLPTTGMAAIQMAASISRRYSRSGLGSRSARRPPQMLPSAMAIMMVPMMMVQTICEELK